MTPAKIGLPNWRCSASGPPCQLERPQRADAERRSLKLLASTPRKCSEKHADPQPKKTRGARSRSKIKPQHTSRKAILYVRQSSPYQVLNNLESQKLQYAMEAHLRLLGWNEVEVIDESLGRSAGGTVTRTGFEQRMVAQVCIGRIGAVCAREVSRFARNSREWQQLVEVCRIIDTVLVDQETIYSPRLVTTVYFWA